MNESLKFKKMFPHELKILFTDNGGIFVQAGCCNLSFNSATEFLHHLGQALENPKKFGMAYFKYLKEQQ